MDERHKDLALSVTAHCLLTIAGILVLAGWVQFCG